MSYKVTCYFNNEYIDSTNVYYSGGFYEYTGYYGEDFLEIGGFTESTTFTAYPSSDGEFTRWVYRLGSVSGTVKYSYANPFTYTGSEDIYIRAEGEEVYVPPTPSRPDTFSWTYTKRSGRAFNLTADEWNELTSNINAVRRYRGYSNYSFTTAYEGDDFTAKMYNQAVNAIKGISGYGSYIYTVSKGAVITADRLNDLRDEINAVP